MRGAKQTMMAALGLMAMLAAMPATAGPTTGQAPEIPFGLFLEGEQQLIPLPLASTRVRGEVLGFVAHVTVTQVYVNPYDAVIEASYVFPLPEQAAVTAMVMHLADRDVVAEIKRREEAQRVYDQAVAAGRTAALMTQERANIFTQKVGNIPPGDKVEVELTYVEALGYDAGVSHLAFPTVVGPRYIPGQPLDRPAQEPNSRCCDTDRVPEASRISPPVLGEGEESAHRIDLELTVAPGLPIGSLSSPSHQLLVSRVGDDRAVVRLAPTDTVPDKDFILRIDLRGQRPEATVLAHRDASGEDGYLTLAVQPPALPAPDEIAPKDLFFVVDNSGSMHGAPIAACKQLVRHALRNMNPSDRFTIMRFSNTVSQLSAEPLENNEENVALGIDFIDSMSGMGGTEMLAGVRAALRGEPDPGRVRIVFFLTDGYIGNDRQILDAVRDENQAGARLFSLGVGSSVNRFLLSGMARMGRGEVQVMRYDEDYRPFVERFYRRVRNPVLTDVELDWGDLQVREQTPAVIGDLFDSRPLLVHARYDEAGSDTVTLRGRIGGREWEQQVEVTLPEANPEPAIASLWARARIQELMDGQGYGQENREQVTAIALAHSLMSQYTAFVAVDHEVVREAHEPMIPVAQRLPLPDGVTRRALGCLSRQFIPPGDPIISVAAPADAQRVTAYFPFGLVKDLHFDPVRALWRGRFLVPAGIADGVYTVRLAIVLASGARVERELRYDLDSEAEEFVARFERDTAKPGDAIRLYVDSVEPAAEVYLDSESLGWERVPLDPVGEDRPVDWFVWLAVPEDAEPGVHEVRVVVRDLAGNRLEQTITIEVLEEDADGRGLETRGQGLAGSPPAGGLGAGALAASASTSASANANANDSTSAPSLALLDQHTFTGEVRDIALLGGRVFLATGGGLAVHDRASGRFLFKLTAAHGLPGNSLRCVRPLDDDRLVVGGDFGAAVLHGALSGEPGEGLQVHVVRTGSGDGAYDPVQALVPDGQGGLLLVRMQSGPAALVPAPGGEYLAAAGDGVAGAWQAAARVNRALVLGGLDGRLRSDASPELQLGRPVLALARDRRGLVAATGEALLRVSQAHVEPLLAEDERGTRRPVAATALARAADGDLLVGTADGRVLGFVGSRATKLADAGGRRVTAIAPDGPYVWLGVGRDGLYRLPLAETASAGAPGPALRPAGEICDNHVTRMTRHRGVLVVGTFDRGACALVDGAWQPLAGTGDRFVHGLASDGRDLYVATSTGLLRFGADLAPRPIGEGDPGALRWYAAAATTGAARLGPRAVAFTSGYGVMRVFRKRSGRLRVRFTPHVAGVPFALTAVGAARGQLFVGSEKAGVKRLALAGLPAWHLQDHRELSENWVTGIAPVAEDEVWVATCQRGAVHVSGGQARILGRAQGLPDERLTAVAARADGAFLGTLGGLAWAGSDGTVRAFALGSGLPDPRSAALMIDNGELWLGTEAGLARFRIEKPGRSS